MEKKVSIFLLLLKMSLNYEEETLNTLKCIENSRASVLHKMYVSNVGNRLREMITPSDVDCRK